MNARDIRNLRNKVILSAMAAIFLAMLFIGATVNLASLSVSQNAIRRTLEGIVESQGEDAGENALGELFSNPTLSDIFSPLYRRNHFFVLIYDETGALSALRSNDQSEADRAAVVEYAARALTARRDYGRYGMFYYQREALEDGGTLLAFLDASGEISNQMRLLYASGAFCVIGLLITFGLVLRFSNQLIAPELENARRQRQFITNASHELKTPLAVIRANTEIEELTNGETEWSRSTLQQVDHMNGLIQNLVMIARAEEREDRESLTEIDATAAVAQSVAPFEALARQSDKTLTLELAPDVRLPADESKLRQLTSLLVDNAIKYCDEGGAITVVLAQIKKGRERGAQLTVSNSYAAGATVDYNRFFDRFYRADESHGDQGGYGIGLSIAESICRGAGGSIRAAWKDGVISFICQLF